MINKLKYTAFIVETEEILECSNFKVLYKAARRHARYYAGYEGAPCTTVRFYVNLPGYQFEGVVPYHTAQW
jgi:hypothetical protein